MRPTSMKIAFLALLLAGLTAACANVGSIEGNWVLESGTGADGDIPVDKGNTPTLRLESGSITGQSHCNSFGGQYRANSSGRFEIVDGLAATEMACMDAEAMTAEQLLYDALATVNSYGVEGDNLVLSGDGVRLVYTPGVASAEVVVPSGDPDQSATSNPWFPPETFGEWELEKGTFDGGEIPIAATHPVTLSISDQGFGGRVCNQYGFVPPEDGNASFPEIFSTMMLCTEPVVMDSEATYLGALRRFESAHIEAGRLVIEGDGTQLIFRPTGGN